MTRNYSNIAVATTLSAGIGAGDASLVVASATGYPAVPFAIVVDSGMASEEVMQVTNKAGTTFTVTRGFDGSTAAAHLIGAAVIHAAIAGDFTDLQAADTTEAAARASADSTNAGNLTTHAALTTAAHGGIVASTDPRLTDSRTPTAHASTHASAGSDPLTLAESQITNLTTDLAAKLAKASNLSDLTNAATARGNLALNGFPPLIVASSTYSATAYADYRCDGVADDVQIQQAIDALPAAGGTVILTAGTFNVTNAGSVTGDTLTTPYCIKITASHGPVQLIGAGMSATTVNLTDAQVKNSISILVRASSAAKRTAPTRIADMSVTCANPATQTAWDDFGMIEVAYSDSVTIERVKISSSPYIGAQIFRNSQQCKVVGCDITYTTYGNGLRVEVPGAQILNNVFNGDPTINKACLDLSCNADITVQGERIVVEGNAFLSGRTLIGAGGQKGTMVVGNLFTGATNASSVAIAIDPYTAVAANYSSEGVLIEGNTIIGCRQGITMGGGATYGVQYTTIRNNVIYETAAVNLANGILENTAVATHHNIAIGNTIVGATTPITIAGTGSIAIDNYVDGVNTGHTHAAADVTSGTLALARGGTGASLVDPNADRILFWDDSAGAVDWLTLGTNLSITGTTLDASAGSGSGDYQLFIPLVYDAPTTSVTWASMPQALTEFNSQTRTRTKVDLTGRTQARISLICITGNASVNTPVLGVQYSLDQSSWNFLDDSAGPIASVATGGAIVVVSGWITLAANAKADVFLRVIGQGGNGSSGTVIGQVALQVK